MVQKLLQEKKKERLYMYMVEPISQDGGHLQRSLIS